MRHPPPTTRLPSPGKPRVYPHGFPPRLSPGTTTGDIPTATVHNPTITSPSRFAAYSENHPSMAITQDRLLRLLEVGEMLQNLVDSLRRLAKTQSDQIQAGTLAPSEAHLNLCLQILAAPTRGAGIILAEERVTYKYTHAKNDRDRERKARQRQANPGPGRALGPYPPADRPWAPTPGQTFDPLPRPKLPGVPVIDLQAMQEVEARSSNGDDLDWEGVPAEPGPGASIGMTPGQFTESPPPPVPERADRDIIAEPPSHLDQSGLSALHKEIQDRLKAERYLEEQEKRRGQ